MQRRRHAASNAQSQDLARRFLQLDTGIRLAAAAGGLLTFFPDDRPESPPQQYAWDGQLQHPKPKPANGPIKIRQLETVAKTRPTLKTRSVSDPGDAHRLVARFIRNNEEKTRSMTVSAMDQPPSPPSTSPSVVHSTRGGNGSGGAGSSARVFPFPSMRRQTTLENFIEMESSANETGREDPLALKMGQILARRAAAATRAVRQSGSSRSSSRAGFGGATLGAASEVKEGGVEGHGMNMGVARPRPPPLDVSSTTGHGHSKRESVVVDDRSPHEGHFWPRAGPSAVGGATNTSTGPVSSRSPIELHNEQPHENTTSFAASRDSLRSFVFPAPLPASEPRTPVRTSVHVQIQSPARARAEIQIQSPVRTQIQIQSPVRTRAQIQVQTQTQIRPVSFVMQASPTSGVYVSPVESLGHGWGAAYQTSPGGYRASPPLGYRSSPALGYGASPNAVYRASPIGHGSDAHVNLLRGLSPLPSHGLPLPARPLSFNLLNSSELSPGARFSAHVPRTENPVIARGTSPAPAHTPPPVVSPPPVVAIATPPAKTPSPPAASSSPPRRRTPSPRLAREQTPMLLPPQAAAASPSPLPTRMVTPNMLLAAEAFPTYSPDLVPTRALSPLPPRLRHHTNASHPSDGSGSDEVVFRGSSSSASSSPAKRRRPRARRHMRAHSDGLGRRTMSEGMRNKRASDGGYGLSLRTSEGRRTGQAQMRRSMTGAGDAGEVSSDGRDVVLFVPRGPLPPVPRIPTPTQPVEAPASSVAPPLVRRESIPLPEAPSYPGAPKLGSPGATLGDPAQVGNPSVETVQQPAEALAPSSQPSRKTSAEALQRPILEAPVQRALAYLPWSPPSRVLSRPEMTSREGSFHTAPDSFVEDTGVDTDAEFPSSVPGSFPDQSYMDDAERAKYVHDANREEGGRTRYVSTPVHMDLSELEEVEVESTMHSMFTAAEEETTVAQDVPERATISSAMRGHVARPAVMARKPSGEFAPIAGEASYVPSPPRSAASVWRAVGRTTESVLSGVFQQGFLIPPTPLAPSPLASSGSSHTPHSSSRTPHSHAHTASIPMRHDDYSPPRLENLPRSVTPRTEASVRNPEDDSFHSAHTADDVLRLPLDDWLEFAMSSMAAMGIPLTRSTLEDLHESEDEVAAVTDALSSSSMRGFQVDEDGAGVLDGASQADEDSGDDSPSRSLSDVSATPSPSRSGSERSALFSGPGFAGMTTFSSVPPESTGTRPTIQTTDLGYSTDNNPLHLSAISRLSVESESERAVESLQNIAVVVREMNARTPIPSAASSSRAPLSAATSVPTLPFSPTSYLGTPSFVGPPPVPGAYHTSTPARALSPGSVSIAFQETSPALSSPQPLVVLPGDRDRFADSLLMAEYQHRRSFQYLRDDDYRALDDGEDVILYGIGGEWEQVEPRRVRTESQATAESGVPIELGEYGPESEDVQSRNKYTQFLLSLTSALRTPGTNRPPRWMEVALRTLRGHTPGSRPRYPSSFFDAIGREEAGFEAMPPPPVVPGHLSSTFISSSASSPSLNSSIGSALPEDDEIVEEFIRRVLTPHPVTPPQPTTSIRDEAANVIPWPALSSPIAPNFRIPRSSSRQTARTHITSIGSSSGYSSMIPPLPRPRSRSVEPHWLAVYMARRWPVPHTYVSRRTFSSPSALGPPMPYHWRPICHISPQRLWEITNLAIRVDMPPPVPPPAPVISIAESASPTDHVRPHFTTPVTTQGRATPHSARTGSSHRSRRTQASIPAPVPVPVHPGTERMTSHPNMPINPSHHSLQLQTTGSRISTPLIQRPLDPQYTTQSSTSSEQPAHTMVASRAMTPAAITRKRTVRDIVGRLIGKERARTRSVSRAGSPSALVGKSRLGFVGRVADIARRLRHPRRRTRVSSMRSQRAQAIRNA